MRYALILLTLTLVIAAGCNRRETAGGGSVATDTIAPAAAQPDTTGTEAMTQTVNLDDGRPEAEGGVLANGGDTTETTGTMTKAPATTTTATTTTTTTAAPPGTTTR